MTRLLLAFLSCALVAAGNASAALPIEGKLPPLNGATWLNSQPLTPQGLRGKVVLVDFWTYSCINCLRALPYVNAWHEKYQDHGLVVIGVHAPEFMFEKDARNVRRAMTKFGIRYPVALDNDSAIWDAFHNEYWPAHYFIDAQGRIRGHHFGEGEYDKSEGIIRQLLTEAGFKNLPPPNAGAAKATGVQAAADKAHVNSAETYIGYARAEHFSSPAGFARDRLKTYAMPAKLELNQWSLVGPWQVGKQQATLDEAPGKIVFRFYARDLHLVLGSGAGGKPIRFRVRLDDAAPGQDHGVDIDAAGNGVIGDHRLYQLIRQSKDVRERTFSIEFLDGGAQAFAFTFG